jgi:hypothetical protein
MAKSENGKTAKSNKAVAMLKQHNNQMEVQSMTLKDA